MALKTNDLYSETTRGPLKRIQPREGPGSVMARAFAAVGGGPTLPVGTPVYVEAATGFLKKIDPSVALGPTNDIFGIIWPVDVVLDAASEVLGTVMFAGAVDFAELEALRVAGVLAGTAQQLKDVARKPSNQERGIVIEGLDKIGGAAGLA